MFLDWFCYSDYNNFALQYTMQSKKVGKEATLEKPSERTGNQSERLLLLCDGSGTIGILSSIQSLHMEIFRSWTVISAI